MKLQKLALCAVMCVGLSAGFAYGYRKSLSVSTEFAQLADTITIVNETDLPVTKYGIMFKAKSTDMAPSCEVKEGNLGANDSVTVDADFKNCELKGAFAQLSGLNTILMNSGSSSSPEHPFSTLSNAFTFKIKKTSSGKYEMTSSHKVYKK